MPADPLYFCNKCGYSGSTGPLHPGGCNYHAALLPPVATTDRATWPTRREAIDAAYAGQWACLRSKPHPTSDEIVAAEVDAVLALFRLALFPPVPDPERVAERIVEALFLGAPILQYADENGHIYWTDEGARTAILSVLREGVR